MFEVFGFFFKLGLIGFGGPLALVSNMQKFCVDERRWINQNEFNSSFALIKAMPGPIAFMVAVYLGRHRAGLKGAFAAAFGLILPAFILMIVFSLFSERFSNITQVRSIMTGMQIAALGVILASLKGLVKGREKNLFFWFLVLISGLVHFYHPSYEPIIILGFGFMMVMRHKLFELGTLFFVCFKAGAIVFGSGLAIVPMLQHDVVNNFHWLTQSEFLDALAFGQLTPGPVVITATYIGHKVAGIPGALVATIAIFLAAFIHMTTWFPKILSKIKNELWVDHFIFGAIAAVTGPIIVSVFNMSTQIHVAPLYLIIAFISFILSFLTKVPVWALIPFGGISFLGLQYLQ